MKPSLCISIRFIQPYPLFHGRGNSDEAEWPPSPMRAFQALLNAACLRMQGSPLSSQVHAALQMIEVVRPSIVAPRATLSMTGHRAYVPHNQTDLVTAAWDRGNNDASIASHRVEKDFRPHRIEVIGDEIPTVHYLYPLEATNADPISLLEAIRPVARSIYCLGWGIDQVVADATLVEPPLNHPAGESWTPAPSRGRKLRVQRCGSLDALAARHEKILNRLVHGDWTPVPPLREFDIVRYRSQNEPAQRPFRVFELRNLDGSRFRYPHARLIHIAGMVRHLAIREMQKAPPRGVDPDWVETYVAGHRKGNKPEVPPEHKCDDHADEARQAEAFASSDVHRQLSYLPLPSIGTVHTDPGVRRVMIAAPVGDDRWLDSVARRLSGLRLEPLRGDEFAGQAPPILVPVMQDNIASLYTRPTSVWHSVTPVIFDGNIKSWKEKLTDGTTVQRTNHAEWILKALRRAGIEQPCEFEWSSTSRFPKSYSAHKYDRHRRLQGYVRPSYLLTKNAAHVTLRFHDGSDKKTPIDVPGPIAIGAGRHCGLGLFAPDIN